MDVLTSALDWGKRKYPHASNHHHASFANSVNYLVSGWSGGFGGPSMREHAVSWSLAGDGYNINDQKGSITIQFPDGRIPQAGSWDFDAACNFCENICYGQLPSICRRIYQVEHCFDDDPNDLKLL